MRQADEARAAKKSGGGQKPSTQGAGSFYTFHPNDSQRKFIREHMGALEKQLFAIAQVLREGHRLTWKYDERYQAYKADLSTTPKDWRDALHVSCWHGDLATAVAALSYYVLEVNPDWPENHPTAIQGDFEW